MRFVYAVINLLILAGLIYLVGRKSIVKIFRSRREKIARELDEAETPFAPEPLPEMPAPDDTALKSELAAAEKDGKAALAELDAQYEADAADQRREMLFTTRAQIIEQVLFSPSSTCVRRNIRLPSLPARTRQSSRSSRRFI